MTNATLSGEPNNDPRSERGLALARTQKDSIKQLVGTKYLVPSATSNGSQYVVDTNPTSERCSCLDFATHGNYERPHRCKHLWAVIHVLRLPDGSELLMAKDPNEPPKKSKKRPEDWKKRNWPATNACRTLIPELGPQLIVQLIDGAGLPEPEIGKKGRPAIRDRDLLIAAALREFEGATAGEAYVDVMKACASGVVTMRRVPKPNTLLEKFADPRLMPYLHRILAASAYVLFPFESGWSVDGTGFGTSVYDHYFVEKHGKPEQKRTRTKRSRWVDARIVYGVDVHVIAAVQITEQHTEGAGEPQIMPELLRRSIGNGAHVRRWYGDAAYLTEECAAAVEKVGAEFFVNFCKGVTGRTKRGALWRLHKLFAANEEEYRRQYEKGHPLCETGNKMLKERFGYSLRSRTPNAMYAECMLRCICHNVACVVMATKELGIDPKYWAMDLKTLPDFGSTQPRMIETAPQIDDVFTNEVE